MNTLKKKLACSLLSLLAASSSILMGCSSQASDADTDEGAATIGNAGSGPLAGVPVKRVLGELQWGVGFTFLRDDKTTFARPGTGSDPISTTDSKGVARDFVKAPATQNHYGWASKEPWPCDEAGLFAYDDATLLPADRKCRIELNATGAQSARGGYELGGVVIPLDANGNGISSYNSTRQGPQPANNGTVQPVTAAPPRTVAVVMDVDAVLAGMKAAYQRFGNGRPVDDATRNDCLKNGRGTGWMDITAHYYCLLPKEELRTCFSTKLAELSGNSDPNIARAAPSTAYDTCLKNSTEPEAKWVHENQEALFKYVMFTRQATADFELESENRAINEYYKWRGEERPRRLLDTYPKWLPEQPRYDAILDAQVAKQAAAPAPAAPGASP